MAYDIGLPIDKVVDAGKIIDDGKIGDGSKDRVFCSCPHKILIQMKKEREKSTQNDQICKPKLKNFRGSSPKFSILNSMLDID